MTSQASPQIVTIIGRNIAAARSASDMTQRELAQHLKLDTRAINRWERGGVVPSRDNLVALAERLGRDPGWFYSRHDGIDYDTPVKAAA